MLKLSGSWYFVCCGFGVVIIQVGKAGLGIYLFTALASTEYL